MALTDFCHLRYCFSLFVWSPVQEFRDIVSARAINAFLESTPELLFGFVDLGWSQRMWIY